jgi:hypothetical protein
MNRMRFTLIFTGLFLGFMACQPKTDSSGNTAPVADTIAVPVDRVAPPKSPIDPEGKRLEQRIRTPEGFERIPVEKNSFAEYLRTIPLKPEGAEVKYYDGATKSRADVYVAVIDLPIGKKDLHQCADAVMRLRAEYLWRNQQYDQIHFNFTNGFRVDYTEWMKGRRMVVKGNKTYWNNRNQPSNTYTDFWNYMELIFMYAGTASLEKELKPVDLMDMQIGDVFIQGGFPGHAVIVMDMAYEKRTGKKLFLLAQSYMPAQELHILSNLYYDQLSPWYELKESEEVATPEWLFTKNDLKRF